ncbi:zinc finger CCCH domain-containing protein 2-like [Phragmites australis]|uniref:zinc finger CCCH domain-containing protein 2-like n=1 Tax=Phragmites australis TaxID=29695 RepID=UPI002D77DEEA|nr:zinc finger CCCH domain-containing protein 2-like [Phragmites australis]
MMMMGEGVSVPPWSHLPVSGVDVGGGAAGDEMTPYLLAALRQYLPCNDVCVGADDEEEAAAMAAAVDAYGCDDFRMYEFKVRRCARGRSHDWTECPFAHPGEKARRRDPRKYHYSGTACPDFRKGGCKRGDACEFAHGVFECWLHPARYRTQPCKDGTACRRRVCFFAHTPDQLRVLPQQQSSPRSAASSPLVESYDGSPLRRQAFESYLNMTMISSSPTSTLISPPKSPTSESPPLSPDGAAAIRRGSWPGVGSPVNDVVASLRKLRFSKVNSSPSGGWSGYPASTVAYGSPNAGGLYSLPSTPRGTQAGMVTASGFMHNLEPLDVGFSGDEEPVQRVESGRALRAKVCERLSREGARTGESGAATAGVGGPDVGWVSDLIN